MPKNVYTFILKYFIVSKMLTIIWQRRIATILQFVKKKKKTHLQNAMEIQ